MNARLLVFARPPVAGAAKTRLVPALGADGAARLHAALVRHALQQAAAAGPRALELWCAAPAPGATLAAIARETGARVHTQAGRDLGARMAHALTAATADGVPAIVVGSDCPWLDATALRAAAMELESADAVIGPALDGGYVLLGLHRVEPALFGGIDWGTDSVLGTTRARLRTLDWHWRELAPRPDIDRPADLERLAQLGPEWAALAGTPSARKMGAE